MPTDSAGCEEYSGIAEALQLQRMKYFSLPDHREHL